MTDPSRLRPRTKDRGALSVRARAAVRHLDGRREVSPMINPLDVAALRRRAVEARVNWGHTRRNGLGMFALAGATVGWGLASLDTLRGMRILNLFLFRYGTVMAAGAAYMMFFSVAAALVAGFSVVGLVVGGNEEFQSLIVSWVDTAVPGLIAGGSGESAAEGEGLVTADQLFSTRGFNTTLVASLAVLIVTSLSWVHGLRSGIRSIFSRPLMAENVVVVKSRDLGIMLLLGLMLITAGGVSLVSGEAVAALNDLLAWDAPWLESTITRVLSVVVPFVLDVLVAVLLLRVASRVVMPISVLWRAALLAGVGSTVLRQLSAELLTGGGVNPILAPFATVLGLFFYFFLLSINYLITAAWAAVITSDREAS